MHTRTLKVAWREPRRLNDEGLTRANVLWSGCAASHTLCSLFSCVSSGAALLSLEHAQLKANSIGIGGLVAAHGLLVAYYGTELWTVREMKKVLWSRR